MIEGHHPVQYEQYKEQRVYCQGEGHPVSYDTHAGVFRSWGRIALSWLRMRSRLRMGKHSACPILSACSTSDDTLSGV